MATIERFRHVIRQDVQSMHAYAVQPSEGLIKLDAMENPFALPAALQRELGERLGRVAINRYPGSRIDDVVAALSAHVNLPNGCKLMLGNGSDELISLLAIACDVPASARDVPPSSTPVDEAPVSMPATVLAPVPGFVMYEMSARLQGLRFVGVPLTASFELDEAAMLAAIANNRPAITYLAYPNNPTANLFGDTSVAAVVDAVGLQDGLVVFDEAYQPFSSKTWLPRLVEPGHEHVLVMRTLSKFGLAGVRLGYLIGQADLIDEIDKVRPPYNVSVLNAEATLFALEHADEFGRQAQVLRAERTRLQAMLAELNHVTAFPSEANMILVRVPDATRTFDGMKARGVLVKNMSRQHPLLANCLRLTVGTPAENGAMLAALAASL